MITHFVVIYSSSKTLFNTIILFRIPVILILFLLSDSFFPPPTVDRTHLKIFTIVWQCIVTDSSRIKPTDALNFNFIGITIF